MIFCSVHDDEYMSKKNYYGQAHEIREIINEQAAIMINGKMKEYQVIFLCDCNYLLRMF
jgi:hypothetical protein